MLEIKALRFTFTRAFIFSSLAINVDFQKFQALKSLLLFLDEVLASKLLLKYESTHS